MKIKIRIAIYSRKSKYTDKGDSVGNQVELSLNYINLHYPSDLYDTEIVIYEDEGFSGGSFKRPQFQQFLDDERNKPYDILICYRLDRISRNLADFSSLMNELNKLNTSFISIKEQFDTKTPMGRAMMYIASVFAQLEREVIAERIRDNMLELSKTGIWLGGYTPTGYCAERYEKVTVCETNSDNLIENRVKKACKLITNEDEMKNIDIIFSKYLELKSLVKLETYLLQNNIKTRNGAYYSTFTLRRILTNLVYVKNDNEILEYYNKKGIHIFSENDGRDKFDGKYGLIAYNKTKDNKILPIEAWIVAVGLHQGRISGRDFINVQTLLEKNADKKYRAVTDSTRNTVMVGILKCKDCGSYMRPKNGGNKKKDGTISYYYSCVLKEKSRGTKCNSKNVKGDFIDNEILNVLKNIFVPNSEIYKELKKMSISKNIKHEDEEVMKLKKQYEKNKYEINSLVEKIKYIDSSLIDVINNEMVRLNKQNKDIEEKIKNLCDINNYQIQENKNISKGALNILEIVDNCFDVFNEYDLKTKRDIINLLVESVYYNSETEKIEINLLNDKIDESKKSFLISISEKNLNKKLSPDDNGRCTNI